MSKTSKILMTYEGLEEYNIKWHERLQAMAIGDDEVNDIFINEMMKNYTWRFIYDSGYGMETQKTYPDSGDDTFNWIVPYMPDCWYHTSFTYHFNEASVPFSLYGSTNASMTIDWGDGTTSTLTSSDFSSSTDCSKNIHYYPQKSTITSNEGTYTISITSSDWNQIYMLGGCPGNGARTNGYRFYNKNGADEWYFDYSNRSDLILPAATWNDTNENSLIYTMTRIRLGILSILDPLPKLKGTIWGDTLFLEDNNYYWGDNLPVPEEYNNMPDYGDILQNKLSFILSYYQNLTSIPSNLFTYNKHIKSVEGAFWGTDSINFAGTEHMLEDCTDIENVSRCFLESASPSEIWLSSNSITSAVDFSDDPITVHLPANSPSATAFQNESNVTIGV